MKVSSLSVLAGLSVMAVVHGADATSPVDYTQRNSPFAPAGTMPVEKKALPTADAVQKKRVEITTRDKPAAAMGERRAALELTEAQPKNVHPNDTRRPETLEQPRSVFNHREASIAPATDTKKPPLVAKYQEGLDVAKVTQTKRMPALNRATTATINRFIFRKNAPEATGNAAALNGATVTPAAGGSAVRK